MERILYSASHRGGSAAIQHNAKMTVVGLFTVVVCLCILTFGQASALNLKQCRTALGMQSGQIPDEAITASSSGPNRGPASARIRKEIKDGAWCPRRAISRDSHEYVEIDLGPQMKVITFVETQGRFGEGQGQEFADQYMLEFQREDNGPWIVFQNRRGIKIFQGNRNTYVAEPQFVDPPIIARRIRFVPYSAMLRTVCMRVELLGCAWKDGTVSYDIHQGEIRSDVNLLDMTYDGDINGSRLFGGLGQLTDGSEGQKNFRHDDAIRVKGYEWVGWRNETFRGKPVTLLFKFDTVRNFTSVRIHSSNSYRKDVHVFKSAEAHFSIGGRVYDTQMPVHFSYMRDTLFDNARYAIVPLKRRIARYVKLKLHFDNKWLMISEIQFDSEIAVGNFTDEILPPSGQAPNDGSVKTSPNMSGVDVNSPPTVQQQSLDEQYLAVIIGTLIALIILIIMAVIIVIITRRRRRKYDATVNTQHQHAAAAAGGKTSNLYAAGADKGVMGWQQPGQTIQARRLPELPDLRNSTLQPSSTDTTNSRDYAVPDLSKSALLVSIPASEPISAAASLLGNSPYRPAFSPLPLPLHLALHTPPDVHYAMSDVTVGLPASIQGVSGGNVYATPNGEVFTQGKVEEVRELPRERLRFIEQLGEGQFGEVHLCDAVNMTELLDGVELSPKPLCSTIPVAVKMLRPNATEQARSDFHKELRLMSRLCDPNIVCVLGVCLSNEPPCVVVEYMQHGDLHNFLHSCQLEGCAPTTDNVRTLSYGCLVYMAGQIASGMKYLESLKVVHRDLAARNCLVGDYFTIKISDFGMSRHLYSSDYYRIEGRVILPIRWMSWESLLLGKFSTKSDVWAFGVTLWEVLSFAQLQPFVELTDQQVIDNCTYCYQGDTSLQRQLATPANCPREIYDLMRECWNSDATSRPTFHEVHMFLQRKNMGYDPMNEQDILSPVNTAGVCI